MPRRTIYVPGWIDRKLRSLLPADQTLSGVARSALEARVHELEGCTHDGARLCAHCHAEVPAEVQADGV